MRQQGELVGYILIGLLIVGVVIWAIQKALSKQK